MPEGDPRRFRKQAKESEQGAEAISPRGNVVEEWIRLAQSPKKDAGNHASVKPSSSDE